MKVIIAGSRNLPLTAEEVTAQVAASGFDVTEVVCGGARGPDLLGGDWAVSNDIPVKYFIPDWNKFGKSAGFKRNEQMAQYADALIALWDGSSHGTKHMIARMEALGKPFFVAKYSMCTLRER